MMRSSSEAVDEGTVEEERAGNLLGEEEEQGAAESSQGSSLGRGLLLPFLELRDYFRRLANAFGWRYVSIVVLVYGVSQGVGEALLQTSSEYYFFDTLGVSPARFAGLGGFALIPWQIKAVFGMISDSYAPWGGMHRSPYMVMASSLGVVSALMLAMLPSGLMSPVGAACLLVLANLSIASPDVMVDASVAERAKTHPELTADAQSLCWGALYFSSVFAYAGSGSLVKPPSEGGIGPRGLFGLFALTSTATLAPALAGWLGDSRSSTHERLPSSEDDAQKKIKKQEPSLAMSVFGAATATTLCSLTLGCLEAFYDKSNAQVVLGTTTLCLATALAGLNYTLLSKVSRDLAGTALYIFVGSALMPSTSVIFAWSHSDGKSDGNCSRRCEVDDDTCGWARERSYPCIDSGFLGLVRSIARLAGLIGVVLFNRYFSHWPFRRIFIVSQILYFAVNLLDLAWVSRLNLIFGIPDQLFLLGTDLIQPVVAKINVMPIFVLAAKVCPARLEGTLFALLMGLSNLGAVVGQYNGAALLRLFGGVEPPEFRHLRSFVFTRTLCYLLPILLVPFFVPKTSPRDPLPNQQEDEKASSLVELVGLRSSEPPSSEAAGALSPETRALV